MEGTFAPRAAALLVIAALLLPHPSFAAVAGPEVRTPADEALPVLASTTKELGASAPGKNFALVLQWFNVPGLSDAAFASLAQELDGIFRLIDVEVSWQKSATVPIAVGGGDPHVNVLLLASDPSAWGLRSNVLGLVFRGEAPSEQVFIFFPAVVRALGKDSRGGWLERAREDVELGRALGRVIAHELVHAIAPDHPHTLFGLMGFHQNREALLRTPTHWHPSCERAFLAALDSFARTRNTTD